MALHNQSVTDISLLDRCIPICEGSKATHYERLIGRYPGYRLERVEPQLKSLHSVCWCLLKIQICDTSLNTSDFHGYYYYRVQQDQTISLESNLATSSWLSGDATCYIPDTVPLAVYVDPYVNMLSDTLMVINEENHISMDKQKCLASITYASFVMAPCNDLSSKKITLRCCTFLRS